MSRTGLWTFSGIPAEESGYSAGISFSDHGENWNKAVIYAAGRPVAIMGAELSP